MISFNCLDMTLTVTLLSWKRYETLHSVNAFWKVSISLHNKRHIFNALRLIVTCT